MQPYIGLRCLYGNLGSNCVLCSVHGVSMLNIRQQLVHCPALTELHCSCTMFGVSDSDPFQLYCKRQAANICGVPPGHVDLYMMCCKVSLIMPIK